MTEHEICKGCRWNSYPECLGTKMFTGEFMKIDNLKSGFRCGQKDESKAMDFSIKIKSDLELIIEDLKARIIELEGK